MEENNKIVSISKEELATLPAASYQGNIILIDSAADAEKAVATLYQESIIGFDTETKPSFKRGQSCIASIVITYNMFSLPSQSYRIDRADKKNS